MTISPRRLMRHVVEASKIREMLGDSDAAFVLSTIEGETDLLESVDAYCDLILADDALIERAEERVKRMKKRNEDRRKVMVQMMEILPEPFSHSLQRPGYTASIYYRSRAKIDAAELPSEYFNKPTPNRVMIEREMSKGNEVRGCSWDNASPTLTIRKD